VEDVVEVGFGLCVGKGKKGFRCQVGRGPVEWYVLLLLLPSVLPVLRGNGNGLREMLTGTGLR